MQSSERKRDMDRFRLDRLDEAGYTSGECFSADAERRPLFFFKDAGSAVSRFLDCSWKFVLDAKEQELEDEPLELFLKEVGIVVDTETERPVATVAFRRPFLGESAVPVAQVFYVPMGTVYIETFEDRIPRSSF